MGIVTGIDNVGQGVGGGGGLDYNLGLGLYLTCCFGICTCRTWYYMLTAASRVDKYQSSHELYS